MAFFNLGWLPGSDKSVITRAQSTLPALKALEALFRRRAEDGHDSLLNVLSYRGHEGGSVEYAAVGKFFNSLRAETPLGNARAEVEVYGQRGNPSCPILFSARFFPAR